MSRALELIDKCISTSIDALESRDLRTIITSDLLFACAFGSKALTGVEDRKLRFLGHNFYFVDRNVIIAMVTRDGNADLTDPKVKGMILSAPELPVDVLANESSSAHRN